MTAHLIFEGVDVDQLATVLAAGRDPGGNPIEPFTDADGGWPLRCCLTRSRPGDTIAIIAWSPFTWDGPYRETGPIVVHADGCPGFPPGAPLPADLDAEAKVLRPYGHDHRIAYDHLLHVSAGDSLTRHLAELLADPAIDFVHARNTPAGCYSFTARRAP